MKYIYSIIICACTTLTAQAQSLLTLINNHAYHSSMDAEIINAGTQAVLSTVTGLTYVSASTAQSIASGVTVNIKWYEAGTTTLIATSSNLSFIDFTENLGIAHGNSGTNFLCTTKEVEVVVDLTKFRGDAMNCVPGSQSENFILRSSQQLMGSALTYPNYPAGLSLQLPVADYVLDVTPAADIYNGLFAYQLDVTNYAGYYVFVFTSGPVDDQNCYAWFQDGTIVNLPHLPPLVGVNELETTLIAYPNPVNDNLNILTTDGAYLNECTITLVDAQGRTVETLKPNAAGGNLYELDLSSVAAGIYNVVFTTTDGNVATKQIVVE